MGAVLEKIENSEAYIAIEVDPDTFEQGLEHAYRKVVKQVSIPGFRRGRVPRPLLEAHFGKEVLYQDALEYVVPTAYEEAITELNIEPIAQPDFDIEEIDEGQPLQVKVRVAVKPDIQLGEIEGLNVRIPRMEITDEDVERRLEDIRSRYAQLEEKTDEPAEQGDVVTIDFAGYIDDQPFDGGSGEDYSLEIGSNTFIPGFEEQLIGLKVDEEKDVKVTFPEEYHAEDLAGREAVFKVKVKGIETRKLRELDDEFAQEVSQFDTMDELREDVRNNLVQMLETRKKELIKQEVLDRALEATEIPLAEAVIHGQIQRMLEQFAQRLASQGLTLEQYFQFTGSSQEDLENDMRPEAERAAKVNFLLEKLVEEKGIEVTDDEMNNQIEEVAKNMGVDPEQAKQNLAGIMDSLEFSVKMDKAVQFLIDHAKIEEFEAAEAADEESETSSDE
jgi:trigger factor